MRTNLGEAIFNMYSDDAACLPDSMTHLFRAVDSEICPSIANNYFWAVFKMQAQLIVVFFFVWSIIFLFEG